MSDNVLKDENMQRVMLTAIEERLGLVNLTPELDISESFISVPEVNRPALQLAGFFDQFDNDRIQIIGNVEYSYLSMLPLPERLARYKKVFACGIPCMIFCRNLEPEEEVLELAREYYTPVFKSGDNTSAFIAEIMRRLNVRLAPGILIHGVLVDINGAGVLITGDSGIGKSEAAIELIQRGHRLVSDDAVEIRKVSDETLIGMAPEMTKHFMELRGIGILDIKNLYGVNSVLDTQRIDMVVKLEEWDPDKNYRRLGEEDDYIEYLGNRVTCYTIPLRPGRNLAVILEAAALNHRQRRMGYNAAAELQKRVRAHRR